MKFKRGISFVLSIILFMVIFVGNNESAFAATKEMNIWNGGSDTKWYDENSSATEFNISTSEELAGLANIVNSGKDSFVGKTINLTNDLYLNNTDNVDSWTNSNKDLNAWTAIGNGTNSFKGTFNGNGYSINGLYSVDLNNKNYIGIFGSVDGGTIKNLCVEKSYKYGGLYSGFIAGNISNNSIVENCFSSGVSTSTKYSGGIVGRSLLSNISNCYYNGKISGSYSGGIVGSATGGSTSNCRNYASIKCEITGLGNHIKVGGIVGECLDNTIINNSYNYGEILFDKKNNNNNNNNHVFVGGVCAGNRYDNKVTVSIDKCVNYGNIKFEGTSNSDSYIGGVCGLGFAKISNSSNKADMNITSSNYYKIGGILGSTHGVYNPIEQNISNCYNVGNFNIGGKGCTLGGVLGQQYNGTKMENTYSSGIINNSSSEIIAGILVGVKRTNSYSNKTTSIITNSYGIKNESINNLYGLIGSNDNNTNIIKNNVDVFNKIDNVLSVDLLEILNKYAKDNNYATFRQGTEKEGYFPQFESYNVSSEINNIKIIGEEHLAWDENYAGILVAENGAELPKEFRIVSNNRVLEEGVDYTYNSENGLIRINNLTSDAKICLYRDAEVSVNKSNNIIYDGKEIVNGEDFTINTDSKGAITYSYKKTGEENYKSGLPVNAGEYTVQAEIAKDNINFINEKTITFDIVINKATPNVSKQNLNAIYGERLKDVKLEEGFAFKEDGDTLVGKVGVNKFQLIYTPEDTENYESVTVDGEITVKGIVNFYNDKNLYSSAIYALDEDILYPDEPKKIGYTFINWAALQGEIITKMIEKSFDLYSVFEANKDTKYTVEYHLEDFNNNEYTVKESEVLTGTTDTKAEINIKDFEGFTFNKDLEENVLEGNINGAEDLVLKAYYNRNTYNVNVVNKPGFEINEVNKDETSLKYDGNYYFTVDINDEYRKDDNFKVLVNNVELEADENGIYSVKNIKSNLDIEVLGVISKTTYITEDTVIDSDLVVIEGDTLIINEGVSVVNNAKITVYGTLINKGSLINDGSIKVEGSFINEGTVGRNVERENISNNEFKVDHYSYNNMAAYKVNEEINLQAFGAYYDEKENEIGSYRFVPAFFNVNNEEMKFDNEFKQSFKLSKEGKYILKVTFEKEIFDGTNWIKNGEKEEKEINLLVQDNCKTVNRVYFRKPKNWNMPCIYVYERNNDNKIINVLLIKQLMKYEGNGLYSYTIPEFYKNPKVVFGDFINIFRKISNASFEGFDVNGVMIYDETSKTLLPYNEEELDLKIVKFNSNRPLFQVTDDNITFDVEAKGGKGPYIYVYKVNGKEVQASLNSKFVWNTKEAGKYEFSVDVIDANGNVESANITYSIKNVKKLFDKYFPLQEILSK